MAYVSSGRNTTLPLLARLSEIATEISAAYARRREYRRTLAELQALSMRELNDLGLNPSMLRQVAWESVTTENVDR